MDKSKETKSPAVETDKKCISEIDKNIIPKKSDNFESTTKQPKCHPSTKDIESKSGQSQSQDDVEDVAESVAAALRCPEKSLERLAEIGKRNHSAFLSTALKTSLSEVLRKSIEANELKNKSLASAESSRPETFHAAKKSMSEHIGPNLIRLSVKSISRVPERNICVSDDSFKSGFNSKSNVDNSQSLAGSIQTPTQASSKSFSSNSEIPTSTAQASIIKFTSSPESAICSASDKACKFKKGRRRHFKGGTYGLYLSPARKKKKAGKKPSESSPRDDEMSLASTENGSYIDSEDGSSMFSEDYNTSSERSLADEEGCSNSRCSPIFMSTDQHSEASEAKEYDSCSLKDDNIDEEPVPVFKVHNQEIPTVLNTQKSVSKRSDMKSIKRFITGKNHSMTAQLAAMEKKYRKVDKEIMITANIHVDEDVKIKVPDISLPKESKPSARPRPNISSNKKSLASKAVASLPCEHSSILENFAVKSENEARQKPVIKTEFIYNSKQLPISTCTCTDSCLELNDSSTTQYFCQAIDAIDDKFVGCCNEVASSRLVRPSVRQRYIVLCEMHLWRMTHHHTCPRCGLFCSQGTFMRCGKEHNGRQEFHFFHVQCELSAIKNPDVCPHCGSDDGLEIVHLEVNVTSPDFSLKQQQNRATIIRKGRAKISFLLPGDGMEPVLLHADKTFSLSKHVLCAFGLPSEKDQELLENLLMELNNENLEKIPSGTAADLYRAIDQHDVKKVLYLLAKGLSPVCVYEEEDGNHALHFAAAIGSIIIVHLLVQAGAVLDPMNKTLRTPLMLAVENNHLDIVKYLVKKRVGLNTRGDAGMTCLHIAAREGLVHICTAIMDSGKAKIDAQDDGGWTPMVWAAEHGHAEVVRYLLDRGGNPEIRDNEGNTALHWAAFSGNVEVCELCLDAGCDVNESNEHGDTPLHIAARQDHSECIEMFIMRNAAVNIRNKAEERPIDCVLSQEKKNKSRRVMALCDSFIGIFRDIRHDAEHIVHPDIALGRERYPIRCINSIDDTEIDLNEFLYVIENCETCPINIDRCISSLQCCRCTGGNCTLSSCTCSAVSFRCWYDKEGRLLPEFNIVDPPLIFECNRACLCDASICYNRVVQKGMSCRLELIRTEGRGWGVRTLKDIPKGTFICEYVGELISDSEADTRQDDSYLFDLDNKDGETFCLDARHFGNISRFINHSCEPNLVPIKIFVDHQDLSFPRIAFFSVRDIAQYEELGFDYGEKFWIIKSKSFTCNCGSLKCKYSKETIHETLAAHEAMLAQEALANHEGLLPRQISVSRELLSPEIIILPGAFTAVKDLQTSGIPTTSENVKSYGTPMIIDAVEASEKLDTENAKVIGTLMMSKNESSMKNFEITKEIRTSENKMIEDGWAVHETVVVQTPDTQEIFEN